MTKIIAGIKVPGSKLAKEVEQLARDTETDLLFHHSNRVFLFGALTGQRKGLQVDSELLYVGAMFHDMGLQPPYASPDERFEVDGANAAASFLRGHRIGERDIEDVWDAIALHTTPGIPKQSGPLSRSSRPASKWTFTVRNMTPSRPNSGKKFALVIQGDTVSRTALSTPSQGERSRSRILPSVTSRPMCSNYGTRNTNASISAKSS